MANQSLFPKALNHGETLDPLRSLWRNVLIVALEDAVGRHWRNKSYGNPRNDFFMHNGLLHRSSKNNRPVLENVPFRFGSSPVCCGVDDRPHFFD